MPEDILDFTTFDECDAETWDVATLHSQSRWHRLYDDDRTLPARKLITPSEQQFRRKKLAKYRVIYEGESGSIRLETDLERTFRALADEWLNETSHLSNPVDKFMHPALVQIIGMGRPAVPLILQEVQKMSGHWFYALRHITRTNPVLPEDEWSVEKTAEAWLAWGRGERLIR